MPAKRTKRRAPRRAARPDAASDTPRCFRLNIEVGDLDKAISFYSGLFGTLGRRQAGARCYFDCGPVTLQVLDVSSVRQPHPLPKALYFTVRDLEGAFARARGLNAISRDTVHGAQGGIAVQPWGERSFYVEDPWGNPMCFVEEGTVYAG